MGQIDRHAYIQRFWPEYAVFQAANQMRANDVMILGVYLGNRGYYSDHQIRFSNDLIPRLIREGNSPTQVRRKLLEEGFSHIILRVDLFNQWEMPALSPEQRQRVDVFFYQEAEELFRHTSIVLLSLKRPGG
jgi:hypothetical protein